MGNFHHLLFHLQLSTRLHLKASALPRINTLRQHWFIHMCHVARVHSMYENTYMWCSRSVLLNPQHAKTSTGVTSSLIHANGKIHCLQFFPHESWIGVSIDTLGAMQFCSSSSRRGKLLRCCANVLSSVCVNVFLGTQIADLIYVHTMHAYVFMKHLVLLDKWMCDNAESEASVKPESSVHLVAADTVNGWVNWTWKSYECCSTNNIYQLDLIETENRSCSTNG